MSDIPTAEEFAAAQESSPAPAAFRLGVVSALQTNGTAKVMFDGDEAASAKQYAYLSPYVPTVGDRVLLASVSGTYIVLGKLGYNVTPAPSTDFPQISVSGVAAFGGNIGFYGQYPVSRRAVYTAGSDSILRTRYNDLVTKLSEIGIVQIG